MDENGYIKIIGRIKVRQWIDFLFLHFAVATVCLCMSVHVCAVCLGGGEVEVGGGRWEGGGGVCRCSV